MLSIDHLKYLCSLQAPFPPPNRRYLLAKAYLAEGVLPLIRHEDEFTKEIFRYLRAKEAFSQSSRYVQNVLLTYPDMTCAFDMHHGKRKFLRPIVEAYLLSGKETQALAIDLGINQTAVELFKMAFYDIDRYLDHPLCVLSQLVGLSDKHGHKSLDDTALWKLVGYFRGPEALDELLHNARGIPEAVDSGGVNEWLAQQTQTMLYAKRLLAVSHLKPENNKHMALLSQFIGQGERQRKGDTNDSPLTAFEQCLDAMLQEIPWSKGAKDLPAPLQEWAGTAVELRAEEEMLLAAGEKLPELEKLKDFQFPLSRDSSSADEPGNATEK